MFFSTQEIIFPTKSEEYTFFHHAMLDACMFLYTGEWFLYMIMGLREVGEPTLRVLQPLKVLSTM